MVISRKWLYLLSFLPAVILALFFARNDFAGRGNVLGFKSLAAQQPAGVTKITIAFAGDMLMHIGLVDAAKQKDGSYDFAPLLGQVAPYLSASDYTVVNLETRLAGAKRGYTGYPCFNSPDSLATALRDAGVDMLGTANNHSMDKGVDGLLATLDTLDDNNMAHCGTARTMEEQVTPRVVDISGVKVAFLNATAMTNGIPVPAGKAHIINLIGDGKALINEAAVARKAGAELVIAFLHYGNEYQRQPSVEQQLLSKKLLANGIDTVIGAHPHVVQPIKHITVQRNNTPYTGYIAYSLGNFASNQRDRYRDSGIIVYLDIEKSDAGSTVSGIRYLPVYVQKNVRNDNTQFRVIPLVSGVTPSSDLPFSEEEVARLKEIREELNTHLTRPAAEKITEYSGVIAR